MADKKELRMTGQLRWLVKNLLVWILLALAASGANAASPGDFNGDGRADILWRNSSTGENYLYLMNGTTIAGEGYLRTVADQNWRIAGVGDFNGDGKADILWRNSSTGENYLYLMNGNTIVGEGSVRTVPDQNWRIVGVGDFNGDGKADILWRNFSTGENYLYPMNGTTILAGEGYLRTITDQNWRIVGVGDFNGDGKADILWRNASTGENYLYPMNGTTILAGEGYLRTVADQNWRIVGVGDFNGDSKADILWRNFSTGENYLYPMNGTAILASEGYVRTVSNTAWSVVQVSDFDGDGRADILWRNSSTGENYLYPMNGTAILAGEGYLRTVTDKNWTIIGGVSGDTTPPSVPTGLTATPASSSAINLQWNASSDNVGVAGYIVRRDGVQIATPTGTSFADSGLSAATTYSYTVAARDAAGNTSAETLGVIATTNSAGGATLPLGTLVSDGPATPEQIALFLPVTGTLAKTATASVRYKPASSSTWVTGHPMHRIRPEFALTPAVGSVPDAFAWPIIDLLPGTTYHVEVKISDGATTNVKTLTQTTRALPGPAGAPNKTISAGATTATIQTAFNGLVAGDVLQFANGTYNVDNLVLNRSGTAGSPIYIRGASRTGVILSDPTGIVLQLQNASYVVIENLTIQGSGVDSGTNSSSHGIEFFDGSPRQTRVTIRNIIMQGVDMGIVASAEIQEFLAYDNTLNGNNQWNASFTQSNLTWNDDGIRIPGFGNCAFNNTLRGFGDSLSYAMHSGSDTLTQQIGVHFYRNDVLMGGDDFTEGDHSHRNNTFYDNRGRNTMTFVSLDPLYGGPFLAARNISINTGRSPLKLNNQDTGHFFYNNTIIRTNSASTSPHFGWAEVQFNNGTQEAWGFRNNLVVYRGDTSGGLFAFEPTGNTFVDFTHNSWFPNNSVWWTNTGGTFGNLGAALAGLPATTPLYGGSTHRHFQDNITISNPWTVTVTLGPDYLTEITTAYVPVLSAGTTPKNAGVVIPNITDGFSGAAPDRGAIIEGRPVPQYGDRTP
jgi:hypothetical protein